MKAKNTQKKGKKGITLVALVITIIILLILAGITIASLGGENGLIAKTELAKEKYSISEAKEKLEFAITELRIEQEGKGESLKKEDLPKINNDEIDVGNTDNFPVEVICGKYKFNVDENFIVTYVGEADGTIITYTTEPEGYTNQDKIQILIKFNNPKGIKEIVYPDGDKLEIGGATERGIDYTVTSNGTYTFKVIDNENKEVVKDVLIDQIDKLEPLDFTPSIENITPTGLTINVNVQDAESDSISTKSGIDRYEYYIKDSTEREYIKYETNEAKYSINNLYPETEYYIYVIAYDKANNSKTSSIMKQTTKNGPKDIYIDSINGSDTTGDGSQNNPFYTLEHISIDGMIKPNIIYNIHLQEGNYTLTEKIFELNCTKKINIYGQKEKTKLKVNKLYPNSAGGSTSYEVNVYRLVWSADTVYTNAIYLKTNLNLYNVAFDINFNSASFSYFITYKSTYKFFNCTLPKNVLAFLRSYSGFTPVPYGNIYLTNCYGGYTASTWGINSNWNYKTNYITATPKVDTTTYRITDDESKWKNVGTSVNPDGSQANLGVYGGEHSWEY